LHNLAFRQQMGVGSPPGKPNPPRNWIVDALGQSFDRLSRSTLDNYLL